MLWIVLYFSSSKCATYSQRLCCLFALGERHLWSRGNYKCKDGTTRLRQLTTDMVHVERLGKTVSDTLFFCVIFPKCSSGGGLSPHEADNYTLHSLKTSLLASTSGFIQETWASRSPVLDMSYFTAGMMFRTLFHFNRCFGINHKHAVVCTQLNKCRCHLSTPLQLIYVFLLRTYQLSHWQLRWCLQAPPVSAPKEVSLREIQMWIHLLRRRPRPHRRPSTLALGRRYRGKRHIWEKEAIGPRSKISQK